MLAFQSGISALRANQAALHTVANNIANANTPGYHRQQIRLTDKQGFASGNLLLGAGVNADSIHRAFNRVVEESKLENRSTLSSVNEQLGIYRQVETVLGPGQGSIHDKLNTLFSDLRTLSTEPDNASKRSIFVDRLQSLTREIQTVSGRLDNLEKEVNRQLERDVDTVNKNLSDLFGLNQKIRNEQSRDRQPNDLLDQFHQKLNDLNGLIDIAVTPSEKGGYTFQLSGGTFYFDSNDLRIEKVGEAFEQTSIRIEGREIEVNVTGGRIGAFQELQNSGLPNLRSRLDTLTNQLLFEFDRTHSTGLPPGGEFRAITGTRAVSSNSGPLVETSAFQQLQAGSLFVSVTDNATGERTLEEIVFDPATQSLDDLAAAMNSIPNLNTQVSPQGFLSVFSAPGHEYDFAGRLPTSLDLGGFSGSSIPGVSGSFSGNENDLYTFTALGSGTIGVTDGLQVQVTDQAGAVVGTLDIGSGYEPGASLDFGQGVSLRFSSGTVVGGESFSTPMVSQADETGVLAALGINSLFQGTSPATIAVSDRVATDPGSLAFSRNGLAGDGANIDRLSDLQNRNTIGNLAFEEYLEQINIDVAQQVSLLTTEQTNLELVGNQIDQEIDSLSGVDPNEEMVYLLQYQKAYEASVRVISTMDQVLTELFSIIR